MKKYKLITIISGLIATTLTIGSVFAAWAVSDNANPVGIKLTLEKGDRKLYLNTGGSSLWDQDGAKFACYAFGGLDATFYSMNACEREDYYVASIPEEYTSCIFVRLKNTCINPSWDDKWDQTEDLPIYNDKDTYTITGWGTGTGSDKKSAGTWSLHSCSFTDPVQTNVQASTCTESGSYDEVSHCTICGKQKVEHKVTDSLGHDYEVTYEWAGDNSSCKATAICNNDGSHKITKTVSSTDTINFVSEQTTAPTCHSYGTRRVTVNFNDDVLGTTYKDISDIPMTEHSWSEEYSYDGTQHWKVCTNEGCNATTTKENHIEGSAADESHGAICSVCEHEYTDPIGHTHNLEHIIRVEATCTTNGNIEYWHCTKDNCGKYYSDSDATILISQTDTVIAAHHTLTNHPATDSTCTVQGNIEYWSCSACGKYFDDADATNEITQSSILKPLLDHTYDNVWHSDSTGHWHECSCGAKDNVVAHTYDSDQKCSVCGYIDTTAYYYVRVYNGATLISSTKLSNNPNSSKELMATGISMTKGYTAKVYQSNSDNSHTWFGTTSSYEHNLSLSATKANGFVTDTGDYIAIDTGTYDFYVKFSDTAHSSYSSTYVNVGPARTIYCTQNAPKINDGSLTIHYWGGNVNGTSWDARPSMSYSHINDQGQKVYKAVIPESSTTICFVYFEGSNLKQSTDTSISTTQNAYYFTESWEDSKIKMGNWNYTGK